MIDYLDNGVGQRRIVFVGSYASKSNNTITYCRETILDIRFELLEHLHFY